MKLGNIIFCIFLVALGPALFFTIGEKRSGNISAAPPETISDPADAGRHTAAAAEVVREKLQWAANLEAARQHLPRWLQAAAELGSQPNTPQEDAGDIFQGKVEKGHTLAEVLEKGGSGNIHHYVDATARVFPLRSFRAGQAYTIFRDPATGRIRRFEYEVNDQSRLIVEGDEEPEARLEEIAEETRLALCETAINDSLFQAVADMGESPQLALKLVDLFGSEINFIRNLRSGDSFSVLVEKQYRNEDFRSYGRILAARFINRGKTHTAWLFRDPDGELHYYNSQGENLKKAFLMAPLAVTRLTSKFTHSRWHPILGGERPHLGVDYAAPTGTPVKAVGEGTVVKREWAGGYGNQIIIRHGAGLESMYSHLSGYARGLREGQKVRQGQVIGFVGNTGMSTGPHLDFRLRQKGEFINPTKVINPRFAPVDEALLPLFKKVMEQEKAYLNGAKLPENYTLASIIPTHVSIPGGAASRQRLSEMDATGGRFGRRSLRGTPYKDIYQARREMRRQMRSPRLTPREWRHMHKNTKKLVKKHHRGKHS